MSNLGMTTIEVKKINRSKVYGLIYQERSVSKQAISQKLNMGLTTVTQNLKALEEDGWICRTGYYESTGGRKAQAIEIVRNARTAIGVFLFKRKIILAAIDLYGEIILQRTVEKRFSADEEYYQFLGKEVMKLANSAESNPDKILGVGIAVQGIISTDGSEIKYAKLLEQTGLKTEDLTRYIPYECIVEHDSKAAAYAEIWNQSEIFDAIILLLNKNLGSALIVDGKVHHGKSMYSGTIEHMRIISDGKTCYCGAKGCLETYCSAESLQHEIGEISFDDFFRLVRSGDSKYSAIWDEYLSNLADAIRNINTVIDSDIIISGFLAPYLDTSDIDALKKKITSLPFFCDRNADIIIGQYGEIAPAVGAALPFVKKTIDRI
ncbi:MAG: ROK family transcriptional regulator [Oscillospiraceae bacterium]|nr:ROK family transcriptional regulator [Oscillospiraceae bacterium]